MYKHFSPSSLGPDRCPADKINSAQIGMLSVRVEEINGGCEEIGVLVWLVESIGGVMMRGYQTRLGGLT
jgi:hypothetical protein